MKKLQTTDHSYQKLLSDISAIYEKARLDIIKTLNRILLPANWQIGERIVKVEQKGNLRAPYAGHLLEYLSGDLSRKYGKGFSKSNLSDMRRFYLEYPIFQAPGKLGWTHLRLLLTVQDKKKRDFFKRQVIKQGWSSRDLQEAIRLYKLKLKDLVDKDKEAVAPKLKFTRGRLYTYKLIKPKNINPEKSDLLLDCGFSFWRDISLKGITSPKEGQIVESVPAKNLGGSANFCGGKTEQRYKLKASDATRKHIYTYKALVERVTDADTIWVHIDLGFFNWSRQKIRFRGIDAPEVSTEKGRRAKEFVEATLSQVPFVIIKTHSPDKYGRYLSDVFYLIGETDAQTVLQEGIYLNQQLLDLGLAKLSD